MTTIATITLPALTSLAAQSGPNVAASLLDNNWSGQRNALSGIVASATDIATAIDAAVAALALPRSYLSGYGISNNVSDATNDIDIAAGSAADSTNVKNIVLGSALTKRLDAAWSVGTNQGWLDIGTIANGTYHAYPILRSDTGVVDAIASRNPGVAATITMTIASPAVVTFTNHGLQAGSTIVFSTTGALPTGVTAGTRYYVIATGLTASAFQFSATEGGAAVNSSGSQSGTHTGTSNPVLPTSYDYFRRIASFVRVGAAIKTFTQRGDEFEWLAATLDKDSGTNPGTSAITCTLTVPIGVNVTAKVTASILQTGGGVGLLLTSLAATDVAPSLGTATQGQIYAAGQVAVSMIAAGQILVPTNTSAQIRARTDASIASTNFFVTTTGYTDRRGRDD